jgi:hypothetical protein
MRKFILIFFLSMLSSLIYSQVEIDMEREFIYKGRHYIPKSPWVTVSLGYGYNFDDEKTEPNLLIDLHARVFKEHYAGLGFLSSREHFLDATSDSIIFLPFSQNVNALKSAHLIYGARIEKLFANFGFFAGPSLNWGYNYVSTNLDGEALSKSFFEPGIYANVECTFKFYYDMGIGLSLWGNANKSYQVAGVSMHLYFSTAFKRQL